MRGAMTRRLVKAALMTAGALSLAVPGLACVSGEDRKFYATFDSIAVGVPEAHVLAQLGPPADLGKAFHLGQREGFEAEYRAAAASRSSRYLFWHRDVDVVCAIGLDQSDRVAYKACGGT